MIAGVSHRLRRGFSPRRKHAPIRGRRRTGAVVVELAFILPFLAALVLGICEIGRALQVRAALSTASRAGCAAASRPGGRISDVLSEVRSTLSQANIPVSAATITILVNDLPASSTSPKHNDKITVIVEVPTAAVRLTGITAFISKDAVQSETTTMLKQG